jgi:hemerythrin superfamily protein
MDAIKMLQEDHKAAAKVMEQICKSPVGRRKEMFGALKSALETHDTIEEAIFYPAVLSHPKTEGFPAVDRKAHQTVEKALDGLEKLSPEEESWMRQFKAMQATLLQHVADEETNIFPKIRTVLSAEELSELGKRLAAERELRLKGPVKA